jgi:mannose-6-phosphate isomerase class I
LEANPVVVEGSLIVLVTDGRAELSVDGFTTAALERGDSAFVPADNGALELIGAGTAFVVTSAVSAIGKAR